MGHYSLLLLLVVWIEAIAAVEGVLEVDLVFPRNETYAPTSEFLVIFAFQNSQLASLVNPFIDFVVWDVENYSRSFVFDSFDLQSANFSKSNPYFEYRQYPEFTTEGAWSLVWNLSWDNCTVDNFTSLGEGVEATTRTSQTWHTKFTTKNGSQAVDIIAATTNQNCSSLDGMVININSTLNIPARIERNGGETCAVMAATTPASQPCRVKIDSTIAASITHQLEYGPGCDSTNPPISCPTSKTSSAQCLVIDFIAVGFGILAWALF